MLGERVKIQQTPPTHDSIVAANPEVAMDAIVHITQQITSAKVPIERPFVYSICPIYSLSAQKVLKIYFIIVLKSF